MTDTYFVAGPKPMIAMDQRHVIADISIIIGSNLPFGNPNRIAACFDIAQIHDGWIESYAYVNGKYQKVPATAISGF